MTGTEKESTSAGFGPSKSVVEGQSIIFFKYMFCYDLVVYLLHTSSLASYLSIVGLIDSFLFALSVFMASLRNIVRKSTSSL